MGLIDNMQHPASKPEDRRRWPRIPARNRVSVTVLAAPEVPGLEGKRYYSWTKDVSVGGLRFQVHSKVPLGAILKLDIQLKEGDGRMASFLHMGRVAWEQESEEHGLVCRWLGVEITETMGGSDRFHRWQWLVDGMLAGAS